MGLHAAGRFRRHAIFTHCMCKHSSASATLCSLYVSWQPSTLSRSRSTFDMQHLALGQAHICLTVSSSQNVQQHSLSNK